MVAFSWIKREKVDEEIRGYACAFWWFVVGALVVLGIMGLRKSFFGNDGLLAGFAVGGIVFYIGHRYFCRGSKR